MIEICEATINNIICHRICNDDAMSIISKSVVEIDNSDNNKVLSDILLNPFLNIETSYEFYHDIDINLNAIYKIAENIQIGENFIKSSHDIFLHLSKSSRFPNIKDGDLIIATFDDVQLKNKYCEALYICKVENKTSFIETDFNQAQNIQIHRGISANKIDKGCLIIFDGENPTVLVIDKNKNETQYWIEDFLGIKQRKNEYYNTQNMMSMTRSFVIKEMPQTFVDVSKADQADILTRSMDFFKEKDSFKMEEFATEVMAQPEVIDSFNQYKEIYEKEQGVEIIDNFEISDSAVKKQARVFKSVIKLDKNFHIYVHGNNQYIKKGYDESTGMYYYQLFFKKEL